MIYDTYNFNYIKLAVSLGILYGTLPYICYLITLAAIHLS